MEDWIACDWPNRESARHDFYSNHLIQITLQYFSSYLENVCMHISFVNNFFEYPGHFMHIQITLQTEQMRVFLFHHIHI